MKLIAGSVVVLVLATGCGSDGRGNVDPVTSGSGTSGDQPAPDTAPSTSAAPSSAAPSSAASAPPGWSVSPDASLQPVPATTAPVAGTPLEHDHALVQGAVDDLAGRLGIDRAEVIVVDARAVTWPDGSLGCPQPGMQYVQRLTDGALAILEANGRRYEYHGGNPLALCEHPTPPVG